MNTSIWTRHADKILVAVALIMGISYPIAKNAMAGEWGQFKFLFLSLRFWLAFFVLLPWAWGYFRGQQEEGEKTEVIPPQRYFRGALIVGLPLVATFGFQYWAFAIHGSTSGGVAFIMAFKVALVLLLTALFWKAAWLSTKTNPLSRETVTGILLATVGLVIFTYQPSFHFVQSDLLAVCAMVGYALFLVASNELHERKLKTIPIVAGASFVIAVLTGILSCLFELPYGPPGWDIKIIFAIAWMGLIPGALGLLALCRVDTPNANRKALILSLEPVFAAATGWVILHEQLTGLQTIGGLLILIGVTIKQLLALANPRHQPSIVKVSA